MKVLVSTFGSAGDLFPLLPLISSLQDEGHEVRCAASRSLGLYLRASGIASFALNDGSELRAIDDRALYTTHLDGWSSWRRTAVDYVAPSLAADVTRLRSHLGSWAPDVVVASGFATAARIVAEQLGIRTVRLSIYPQHEVLAGRRPFLRAYVEEVRKVLGAASSDDLVARMAWGAPADALLHDPVLLEDPRVAARAIGFPYWDSVPVSPADLERALAWLDRPGPHVLVTLGSFVGLSRQSTWVVAADAVAAVGGRALFVGARDRWSNEAFGDRPDVLCVGFLPLSQLVPRVDAVVHHGGLGTTFAALRADRPAVVVPQAFDQGYNGRMVERMGAGLLAGDATLADGLRRVLGRHGHGEGSAALSASLVPVDRSVATQRSLVLATGS